MRKWLLLAGAIVSEVIGTMSLRAVIDNPAWLPLVVVAYLAAFTLLGLTLRTGMALGVAYGIWGACGVALTAVLGALIFGEYLSVTAVVGIAVIIVGVIVVETGAHRPGPDSRATEPTEATA
ncbi:DMT family transporter [Georgenia subflava]|uniref:QacE family quaternary ammonium compound efflux SMR transporter n=1 Tax=Georgenia subflava TaxID=1622177 RepID=A0A6N7EH40_9MICO|nr:SMR family transporter [Georgenia subflava]MPV36298.1 QacE family quaternary ammonium compound efflux SMR transporter [Georgenia subflava]